MFPIDSQDFAVISVKEFQAADTDAQKQLIPNRPGLYTWTHNIERLLKADEPTISAQLTSLLSVVGKERMQPVKPYYVIKIQDRRLRIHDSKRIRLHERICAHDPLGGWIAAIATQVQRPLYVGMALDLNERINQHLSGKSELRKRLRDAEPTSVDMLDLTITWMAAPEPDLSDQQAQSLTAVGATAEAETGEGEAAKVPDEAEAEDSEPPVTPKYQVGGEMDLTLKTAESLLIRLAMPMFNEKQD